MKPRFERRSAFQRELSDRVAAYFEASGLPRRGMPAIYRKTTIVLLWFGCSYFVLVFVADSRLIMLAATLSLAASAAAVCFNIPHDAAHGGYSRNVSVNKTAALLLDVLGASSYVWRWKHNVLHHSFPNITGADDDVDLGPVARMTPDQQWRSFHRFQHLYLWPVYGLLVVKWQCFDDFRHVATGCVGSRGIPRPRAQDLLVFACGKVVFVFLALALPLAIHPVGQVLAGYALWAFATALILAVTFQLAHCVEEAAFPKAQVGERLPADWAVHQVSTTTNFAPGNRALTWYTGALNFQIEHHLFPSICHVHYPVIAPIVESVCRAHGVRYYAHHSLRSALASHFRLLRSLGRSPASQCAEAARAVLVR